MSCLVAIDPGGEHVGVAGFGYGQDEGAVCIRAIELAPVDTEELIWAMCVNSAIDALVIESWRLFPDMAPKLAGSDMPTSQLIGSLRFIARRFAVPVTLQDPVIKVPMAHLLRAAEIPLRSVKEGKGGHAKDAELHGWRYLVSSGQTGRSDLTETKREARTGHAQAGR